MMKIPFFLPKFTSSTNDNYNSIRVIDFDDCIFRVAKLLQTRKDICERLQGDFTHFLVDEFQDTNFSQLYILEFASKHNNICVVGDDDQSIYSWRGAMIETLDRFEKIFPDTKLVKLEQNYRCTKHYTRCSK